ncbi:GtrA family protein [Halobacterium jilantaiense]|uniref:Putative flippase GtrA (Transmembrane translocase of bactoprenol-linked glucose) n=1 Tax=Halobacterium jilantaiense TaxID=355548 RepID=A0A1I0Q3H2_9EURY|nr:GtrA family protein [Halobacterium jilantaiense]SEW21422.1 Putative flippase GtrA (transmembrane translocase of bactoprenol-linked glucose) [Halobacterium jilantaiense]
MSRLDGSLDRVRAAVPARFEALVSGVRFGQFVSVGVVGAAFDVTTLLVLTEFAGLSAAVANVASIETAILVMFTVNEHWTFADEGGDDGRSLGRRLLRSHVVRAGGSTLQYLLFVGVFYSVSVELAVAGVDLWLVLVKGGAIAVAMLVNYVFESIFTWQVHRE